MIRRHDQTAPIHPSESGAAAVPVASASLAALLAGGLLGEGEIITLLLRPSRWFIILSSLRFLAVAAILTTLAVIFDEKLQYTSRHYVEVGITLAGARLMWATVQWMSRYYILTNLRIVRLAGVFSVEVFQCPLRKVARPLLERTFKERVVRIGSIAIIPQDEEAAVGYWTMVAKPRWVQQQILLAIRRARQGGGE